MINSGWLYCIYDPDSMYECEQDKYCKYFHYSLSCKTDHVSVSLLEYIFVFVICLVKLRI